MNDKQTFKPFISADQKASELTVTSIIIGLILAVVFGAANAYLGLRVGMTVSASIPSAVISMGVIRVIMKKESILENNMVQTIGSAGESLAAGVIFTMPALFMWAQEGYTGMPSLWNIIIVALIGGILGVLFMIPLRVALIVQEHGVLPYPEGMACAEVLLAGEEGGSKSKTVFGGLGIAAIYKFIADGLKLFPSEVHFEFTKIRTGVGIDVLPALLSVGYICGPKISSYMLCGGILAWIVLVPLLALFGGNAIVGTASVPISEMDSFSIWSSYIRYIGAGAVAAGGIISLVKSLPMIVRTFRDAMKGLGKTTGTSDRTSKDMPMSYVLFGILACILAIWLVPAIEVNLFGAFLIVLFGFFFATVSSRMVGIVGSSNNPVSGMAIATLLFSTIMLKATGNTGGSGMVSAITIGTVICIVAAMAGDTSQDLKTGYILGATPVKQQLGEVLGSVVSAFAIGGTLYLLNSAWGFGSPELPAPQATLMKLVVEGVMEGNLPWVLILSGAGIAVVVEILGIPVLPFAIGLYLPIHLSTPIMAGGIIRLIFEKKKYKNEATKNNVIQGGVLFTSGMIAGEGLIGILLAVFAVIPFAGTTLSDFVDISDKFSIGNIGGLIFFVLLMLLVAKFTVWNKKNEA